MAKKSKPKSGAKRKTSLAGFFRTLHKKPGMMEQFASGTEGRKAVIEGSDLAPEHKKLLKSGCVPDIIAALAGVAVVSTYPGNTSVECCEEIKCGHPHCEAFSKAAAIPIVKNKAAKKPKTR
jgi:hypothetical protein